MPSVPFSAPEGAQITSESLAPTINPDSVGRAAGEIGDAAGQFAEKLLRLEQAQQIAKGSLAIDDTLEKSQQQIQESSDYKGYGARFNAATSQAADQINGGYSGVVQTELLSRLAQQKSMRSHQLDAWAYNGTMQDAQQVNATAMGKAMQNSAYATGAQRQFYKNDFEAQTRMQIGTTYTPEQAEELIRNFHQQSDFSDAKMDVVKDPKNTGTLLADPKNYSNITPDQRSELLDFAQKKAKQDEALAVQGLQGRASNALAELAGTGHYTDTRIDADITKSGNQEFIDNWKGLKAASIAYNGAVQEIKTANPAEIPGILERFNPSNYDNPQYQNSIKGSLKGGAGSGRGNLSLIKDFGTRQQLYKNLSDYATTVMTAATNDRASLSWSDATQGASADMQDANMGQYIDKSDALLRQRGLLGPGDSAGIPNQRADQLVHNYELMDPTQRQAYLKTLQMQSGSHFDEVLKQVLPKLPSSTLVFNTVSPDTFKNVDALSRAKVEDLEAPLNSGTVTTLKNDTQTAFLKLTPSLPSGTDQTSQLYTLFYKTVLDNATRGMADPVGSAQQSLFSDKTYGSQFDGTWRAPQGVDLNHVQNYGQFYIQTKLKGVYGAGSDGENQANIAGLAVGNNWTYHDGPTGQDGRALPGYYYLRDANSQQVYSGDGKPVAFPLSSALLWNGTYPEGFKAPVSYKNRFGVPIMEPNPELVKRNHPVDQAENDMLKLKLGGATVGQQQ